MNKTQKLFLSLALSFFALSNIFAIKYPGKTSHYVLENGLNVFITENHSVPLVYIEIAVRTGAISQTKEDAGLFHLYEHMMFKGNTKYPTSSSFQKALTDMGVASWNGSTSVQCVNYFFTIPTEALFEGLDFWSNAVRNLLLNPKELENEKEVVISEIVGNQNKPSRISWNFLNTSLFPDAPWQCDPSGSEENVQKATVEDLRKIQSEFYVPNNAALFIGGDVNPKETLKMVKEIYGDWEKNEKSKADDAAVFQNPNPLKENKFAVFVNDEISPQIAQVEIVYRGPDSDVDLENMYPGDVLSSYMRNPTSDYKSKILANEYFQIPDSDYIGASNNSYRRLGTFMQWSIMFSPEKNLPDRVKKYYDETASILKDYSESKKIVPKEEKKIIVQGIKDSAVWDSETSKGSLSTIRSWWADCGAEYCHTYLQKVSAVKDSDISSFLKKYIVDKNALVIVSVNPATYEAQKSEFEKEGFIFITKENAYWWSK